jgi:hypothetical protein
MHLSANFTLADLCFSETAQQCGLDNTPPPEALGNLRQLASRLEEIQSLLGAPLELSSAYRSATLNAAVGGASGSHHVQGWAADFACPGYGTPMQVALAIAGSGIAFDTVILEFGRWVHLSVAPGARRRVLSIHGDGAGYVEGLWDPDGTRRV